MICRLIEKDVTRFVTSIGKKKFPIAKLRLVSGSGGTLATTTTYRHIGTSRKILVECRSLFVALDAHRYPTNHCED